MITTVLIALLIVGGVIGLIASRRVHAADKEFNKTTRGDNKVGGVVGLLVSSVVLAVGLLWLLFSSVAIVQPYDVGVKSAFGHMSGDLGPGIHPKAPWITVTNWDDSTKIVSYGRNTDQSKPNHCLQVRIGNQQSACVTLTFAYHVRPSASDAMYVAYRGDQDRMHNYLVVRTLDSDLNRRLETFSPIQASAKGQPKAAALTPYVRLIENDLRHLIGGDVVIPKHALVMPYVAYDRTTTAHINDYQAQLYRTAVAQQAAKTAVALAAANRTLAASVSHDPNVIAYQCLIKVMEPLVADGKNPAGVTCPGGAGASGGSTVVVPVKG